MARTTQTELLDRWIAGLKLSSRELARRLGVSAGAISNWRERGIPFDKIDEIDRALNADGMFKQLAWAATTPDAIAPAERIDHNLAGDHKGSSWVWVRPERHGDLNVIVRCGIVEAEFHGNVDSWGVFLLSPIAVANPPLRIAMEPAGWVDVGTGALPPFLGFDHTSVFQLSGPRRAHNAAHEPSMGAYLGLFAQHLASSAGPERLRKLPSLIRARRGSIERFVENPLPPERAVVHTIGAPAQLDAAPNADVLRRGRVARGLSQPQLADLITASMNPETAAIVGNVDRDRVWRMEHGRDLSQSSHRVAALASAALQLGSTAGPFDLGSIRLDSGPATLSLQPWWNGDIWMSPSSSTRLTLVHGWYTKPVDFTIPGAALWTRAGNNSQPMTIIADLPVEHLRYGFGRPVGAVDHNDNWRPSSQDALRRTMEWGEQLVPGSFGLRPDEFYRALYRRLPSWLPRR